MGPDRSVIISGVILWRQAPHQDTSTHIPNLKWRDFSHGDQQQRKIFAVGASLVTQMVKNLPAMQETWVQSPGQKDPLQESMTTHSSILAWRILSALSVFVLFFQHLLLVQLC